MSCRTFVHDRIVINNLPDTYARSDPNCLHGLLDPPDRLFWATRVCYQRRRKSRGRTYSGVDASLSVLHAISQNRCSWGHQTWHRNVPPWVLETHLIWDQRVKTTRNKNHFRRGSWHSREWLLLCSFLVYHSLTQLAWHGFLTENVLSRFVDCQLYLAGARKFLYSFMPMMLQKLCISAYCTPYAYSTLDKTLSLVIAPPKLHLAVRPY